MAIPDFSVIATARTRAMERSGVTDTALVDEVLELSAGTNASGTRIFRPWYAAAVLVRQARTGVIEAEGAKLRAYGTRDPRALEAEQAKYDEAQDLTVPDAYVAWAHGRVSWGL